MPSANPNSISETAYPGRRILLWGGGGKTTLSRALGEKLDLPVIELDALFHMPGWVERDRDEFRELALDTLAVCEDGWIADGQYMGALGGEVIAQADTLIWLDLPFRTSFGRVIMRTIRRCRDKERICGDNYETWRKAFLSRDSLLLYLLKRRLFRNKSSKDQREKLIRERGSHLDVIRLKSARALDRFYDEHGLVRV
ncbi:MAG: adenylate kinase [Dehalococcoidia bacterium]|jgi:adenylate kinase family enzyme|nr:adenylate kinase [Dehalococcoidia bacterium]